MIVNIVNLNSEFQFDGFYDHSFIIHESCEAGQTFIESWGVTSLGFSQINAETDYSSLEFKMGLRKSGIYSLHFTPWISFYKESLSFPDQCDEGLPGGGAIDATFCLNGKQQIIHKEILQEN